MPEDTVIIRRQIFNGLHVTDKDLDRFWAKVNKNGPIPEHRPELGPCWVWTAHCNVKGYGNFTFKGDEKLAHRFSYEVFVANIEDGLFICHHCDNPPCVNQSHLFQGTRIDNVQDAVKKERMAKGETHSKTKLTAEQVMEIRKSDLTYPELAERYGMSLVGIKHIRWGLRWKHLPCDHAVDKNFPSAFRGKKRGEITAEEDRGDY